MLAPVRRFFPEPRQRLNGGWRRARVCTPPRISPSCPHYVPLWLGRSTIVRGQDHCEAACQSCFWMDGYRSSPSWAVFIQEICTGGLRASSASLFHFWLVRLMSFQSLDMYFSSCMRGTEKVPSLLVGIKSRLFTTSFEKFFNFFQNSSFALADGLLSDMHDPCHLLLRFLILIPQRQQDFLFHG